MIEEPEVYVLIEGKRYRYFRHDGMRMIGSDAGVPVAVRVNPNKCLFEHNGQPVVPELPKTEKKVFCIDFETEGLNVNRDRVLSCSVITTNCSFHWYIKQPYPASSIEAIKCHGINNDDWRIIYSPHTERDLVVRIATLVESYGGEVLFVAHNGVRFDFVHLLNMFERYNVPLSHNVTFADTMVISRAHRKGKHNLKDACVAMNVQAPSVEVKKKMFEDEMNDYDVPYIISMLMATQYSHFTEHGLRACMEEASSSFHSAAFDTLMCIGLYQKLCETYAPTRLT